MVRDKREAKHRSVRYGARLALADGTLYECVLSEISETGARITVQDAAAVPEKFVLVLSANGASRRNCCVVWRDPQQLGVKFEQSVGARAPAPPRLRPRLPGPAAAPAESAAAESEAIERVSLPT